MFVLSKHQIPIHVLLICVRKSHDIDHNPILSNALETKTKKNKEILLQNKQVKIENDY